MLISIIAWGFRGRHHYQPASTNNHSMPDPILPQEILRKRNFEGVILDPPEFKPGYWCGAGKLWIDPENATYWLTSRPRAGSERRGYAAEIYHSEDGLHFDLASSVSKEEVSELSGEVIQSIENQQLLRDPSSGAWHLYLSLDVYSENVAGDAERVYESKWETFLLTADDPCGPWRGEGFVLRADRDYDGAEARDCTIDIVDGRYLALYKARARGESSVNMALATSRDGKAWEKLGVPSVNGRPQPEFFLLNGSILATPEGPAFIGIQTTEVVKGAALSRHFASYLLDLEGVDLGEILLEEWKPGSDFEDPAYPIHTYSSLAYDDFGERWMMVIEAVDPTRSIEPGLNLEVDRVLLYTSKTGR